VQGMNFKKFKEIPLSNMVE